MLHEAKHPACIGEVEEFLSIEHFAELLHVANFCLEVVYATRCGHLVRLVNECL